MEKIEAYKTSDGQIFQDENSANIHEANLDLKHNLKYFIQSTDHPLDNDDLLNFLIENSIDLYRIFKQRISKME